MTVATNTKVIGISGYARSGKDTVAEIAADLLDGHTRIESFADLMKVSAARALGFQGDNGALIDSMNVLKDRGIVVVHWPGNNTFHSRTLTGRLFLQLYGSEAHRDVFGDDFWTSRLLPTDPPRDDCDTLIIPSVRFASEVDAIKAYGGEVWQVERPGVGPTNQHASEERPDGHSVTILNDGSLDTLRDRVRDVLIERGYKCSPS